MIVTIHNTDWDFEDGNNSIENSHSKNDGIYVVPNIGNNIDAHDDADKSGNNDDNICFIVYDDCDSGDVDQD